MYMKKIQLVTLGLLVASFLTACGFHLRGSGSDLSQKSIVVDTLNPAADFERKLLERLDQLGATGIAANSESKAGEQHAFDWYLKILDYPLEERVIARDSFGRPSEIELILTLNYHLLSAKQLALDPMENKPKFLKSRREFGFDRNSVTGQDNEKRRLVDSMRNDIVNRLIQQMAKPK